MSSSTQPKQGQLCEAEEVEAQRPPLPPVGSSKTFRAYDQDQLMILPPSLDELLPEDHLARFVSDVVDTALNFDEIYDAYVEERGFPPYDPKLMVKLLIYGYATGTPSSRKLQERTYTDLAVRYLTAGQHPDFRSICRFRKRHLKALAGIFYDALKLCHEAGLTKLGTIAIDGTKVRASASRHKAMSYQRMEREIDELEREIGELLTRAEEVDSQEDRRFGEDRRGDELPDELARRQSRLKRIKEAKDAIDEQARAEAKAKGKPAEEGVPKPKAQRNFTDPESRIMKTSDKSFHQCYNAQIAVDSASQVIIGMACSNQAADAPHLAPMLDEIDRNLDLLDADGAANMKLLADAGYFSEQNVDLSAKRGLDAFIATGKTKHAHRDAPAPRGRIPSSATVKERMHRKLRTKRGREIYAKRKTIVEPVFGQMDTTQRAKQLLIRGLDGAGDQWRFSCGVHNLLKLHRAGGLDLYPVVTQTLGAQDVPIAFHMTATTTSTVAPASPSPAVSATGVPGWGQSGVGGAAAVVSGTGS